MKIDYIRYLLKCDKIKNFAFVFRFNSIYTTIYGNFLIKYNKVVKVGFMKIYAGKRKFTKSKNRIKENMKRKIVTLTFCCHSHIPQTISYAMFDVP